MILFPLLQIKSPSEKYSQEAQVIITMPLLEGLDGVEKMSKSLGNVVGLNESAEQAFGKLMSISDDLMSRYFKLLLHKSDIDKNIHPMDLKKQMSFEIVKKFWSAKEAQEAGFTLAPDCLR